MVNLLIPTDFSQASFRLAEQAVKTLNKEVNIILFHVYEMPNGINDLIRPEPPYSKMITDSFRKNCRYLKYKYPGLIQKICFQYLLGNTQAVFNNFVDANEIDMIICPDDYVFTKSHRSSIDPVPFFKKSKITVLTSFQPAVEKSEPVKDIQEEVVPAPAVEAALAAS